MLRDITERLQTEVRHHRTTLNTTREALREAVAQDTPAEKERNETEVRTVLNSLRSHVEGILASYLENGTLPASPVHPVHLPNQPLPPLPSTLPRRRGRPARSHPRPSVLPPELAHLVPARDEVKAREVEAPIRRKGVKRTREDLEREKRREEEEGEVLRGLVGVRMGLGVWAGGGKNDEGVQET